MFKYKPEIEKIKRIAYEERNSDINYIKECDVQGYSSTTYIIEYIDKHKIIIQFRREFLNSDNFKEAYKILGNIVPEIKGVENSINTYIFSCIKGVTLSSIMRKDYKKFEEIIPNVAFNLGKILSKCILEKSSHLEIKENITPILEDCILNKDIKLLPYIKNIEKLLNKLKNINYYPLGLTHGDLSPTNILVDLNGNITGIVDWEDMCKLPFGIDLSCIHWFIRNEDYKLRKNFNDIEKMFWKGLFENNNYIKLNKDNLENIMHIGCLMLVAYNGKCINTERCDKQLEIELSYKIPDI